MSIRNEDQRSQPLHTRSRRHDGDAAGLPSSLRCRAKHTHIFIDEMRYIFVDVEDCFCIKVFAGVACHVSTHRLYPRVGLAASAAVTHAVHMCKNIKRIPFCAGSRCARGSRGIGSWHQPPRTAGSRAVSSCRFIALPQPQRPRPAQAAQPAAAAGQKADPRSGLRRRRQPQRPKYIMYIIYHDYMQVCKRLSSLALESRPPSSSAPHGNERARRPGHRPPLSTQAAASGQRRGVRGGGLGWRWPGGGFRNRRLSRTLPATEPARATCRWQLLQLWQGHCGKVDLVLRLQRVVCDIVAGGGGGSGGAGRPQRPTAMGAGRRSASKTRCRHRRAGGGCESNSGCLCRRTCQKGPQQSSAARVPPLPCPLGPLPPLRALPSLPAAGPVQRRFRGRLLRHRRFAARRGGRRRRRRRRPPLLRPTSLARSLMHPRALAPLPHRAFAGLAPVAGGGGGGEGWGGVTASTWKQAAAAPGLDGGGDGAAGPRQDPRLWKEGRAGAGWLGSRRLSRTVAGRGGWGRRGGRDGIYSGGVEAGGGSGGDEGGGGGGCFHALGPFVAYAVELFL